MKMNLAELKRLTGLGKNATSQAGRVLILDGINAIGYRVVNHLVKGGYSNIRVGMRELPSDNSVMTKQWEGVERVKFLWEDEATYVDAL